MLLLGLPLYAQQHAAPSLRVVVRFQDDVSAAQRTTITQAEGIVRYRELGEGMLLWELPPALFEGAALREREAWIEAAARRLPVKYIEPDLIYRAQGLPDDPELQRQWGLNNEGQSGGTTGADVHAFEAWELATDAGPAPVAVIDAGIDWRHPDLAENIWQNLAEDFDGDGRVLEWTGDTWVFDPGDINGLDDDGNGYADDFIGWDFVNDDNDPYDDTPYGHGTHVAGIMAAKGNNGRGITGLCWNARIMPLKFLNASSQGFLSDAVRALDYATQMGAKISNNSWGGYTPSQALYDAILAAQNQNHLFVAAAGNDGINNDDTPLFPASYELDNILSVAASDPSDQLASFSNYGPNSVDLAAPGYAIYSTVSNNLYGYGSGTSMAAPWVSGAAALLWSMNPGLHFSSVKRSIMNQVDLVPALQGSSVSSGRLNVFQSLSSDPGSASCPTVADFSVMDYSTCRNQQVVFVNQSEQAIRYRWEIEGVVVGQQSNLIYTFESPGIYAVSLVALGNSCEDRLTRFVTVSELPQLTFEAVSLCREAAWLDAGLFPGISYEWRDDRNQLIGRKHAISVKASGTYELLIRDRCGNQARYEIPVSLYGDCVWPGDVNADGLVDMKDYMSWGFAFGATGPARPHASSQYTAQPAPPDWPGTFAGTHALAAGVNFKHADCNGDGRIDMQDAAIIQTLAQSNVNCSMDFPAFYSPVTLSLQSRQQFLNLGDTWEFDMLLSDMRGPLALKDVYGLMFGLSYTVPFEQEPFFHAEPSWLGTMGQNLSVMVISNDRQARLLGNGCTQVGVTRLDEDGATGSGLVGVGGISITIADVDTYGILADEMPLNVNIEHAAILKKNGSLIPIFHIEAQGMQQVMLRLRDQKSPEQQHFAGAAYPNPGSGYVYIPLETQNSDPFSAEIRNVHGQQVYTHRFHSAPGGHAVKIPLPALANGVYFLTIRQQAHLLFTQKLIILNN